MSPIQPGPYLLPTVHAHSLPGEFRFCRYCKPIRLGHSSERHSDIYRSKSNSAEELYIAGIDVKKARDKWMTHRNELLEDRRPEYYTDIIGK